MEQNQIQNHEVAEAKINDGDAAPVSNPLKRALYILSMSIIVFALIVGGSIVYAAKKILAPRIQASQQLNAQASQPTAAPAEKPAGPTKVSIDNDPIMGSKDAPVTVIEFADYECPFCKKSFQTVLPQLKRDYIDTGKVKFVYRDFPLDFHENAQKEAEAAECARDQGGDAVYYKYHDQIYTQTKSDGTGLALTQLPIIAKNLGLDTKQFQQCLDAGKYADEVSKDYQDGIVAGVTGTPGWFVGKSGSDNTITAPVIEGAQPYTVFKTVIEQQLK